MRDTEILISTQGKFIRIEYRDQGLTRSAPLTADEALKLGESLTQMGERARQYGKAVKEDGV